MSLLMFCGLILPFYNSGEAPPKSSPVGRTLKVISKTKNHFTEDIIKVSPAGGDYSHCHLFFKGVHEASHIDGASADFSFLKDIAGVLFPILKNLN